MRRHDTKYLRAVGAKMPSVGDHHERPPRPKARSTAGTEQHSPPMTVSEPRTEWRRHLTGLVLSAQTRAPASRRVDPRPAGRLGFEVHKRVRTRLTRRWRTRQRQGLPSSSSSSSTRSSTVWHPVRLSTSLPSAPVRPDDWLTSRAGPTPPPR